MKFVIVKRFFSFVLLGVFFKDLGGFVFYFLELGVSDCGMVDFLL